MNTKPVPVCNEPTESAVEQVAVPVLSIPTIQLLVGVIVVAHEPLLLYGNPVPVGALPAGASRVQVILLDTPMDPHHLPSVIVPIFALILVVISETVWLVPIAIDTTPAVFVAEELIHERILAVVLCAEPV